MGAETVRAKKVLMYGNEVLAEAAIRAGCRCYFGYPITPQNEISAYMSRRMPEEGGVFIQAESELAAISMVHGASAVGARAMTSSSSPGVSLKQEGISYIAGSELPAVIVNVMRGGPGLGNIGPAQSDYFQAVKGGGHGDYHQIVLAPASAQEVSDITFLAFDLADKYCTPVMIMYDGVIGQMMEPVVIDRKEHITLPPKDWALTGCRGRKPRVVKSLYLGDKALERHNFKLQEKYKKIVAEEVRYEAMQADDAKLIVVAYGICARLCKSAMLELRKKGLKIGMIRPITLWPFPAEIIGSLAGPGKQFLAVEMSFGQMVEDVRLAVNGKSPVNFYGRGGGETLLKDEIVQEIERLYAKI